MAQDSTILAPQPPGKRVSARFSYRKMTAEEFSIALDELDLSPNAFARIFGARTETVARWLKGEQDPPPWLFIALWLMREAPSGVSIARTAAAHHIEFDRKFPERGAFPYMQPFPDDDEDSP